MVDMAGNTTTSSASSTNAPVDGQSVRSACTSNSTQRAYRSYMNGISRWIRASQADPDSFFDSDGAVDINVFSPSHFEAFLVSKMNDKSQRLKVATLMGYRSAVRDIYRRKRMNVPHEYDDDFKTFFRGLKHIEAERDQSGGLDNRGKSPLPYSVYVDVCLSTLLLNDGGFAHLFLVSQWNLMSRSKSVQTIHTSHLSSADDSVGCVFIKTKTNQDGSGPKDPRHLYANPFAPETCWVTALGLYLACHPQLAPGPLFPGSNQKIRYGKAIERGIKKKCDARLYGTHSVRKGVATFACGGSTCGPTIVSVCLRCGWSIGGIQDRYIRYDGAADQFLGRVVAGLPLDKSEFGVLPPHFGDDEVCLVRECLHEMFPLLAEDAAMRPILRLCLASLVFHFDFMCEKLPAAHPLKFSYVYRRPDVLQSLQQALSTTESNRMRSTGIPPFVSLYQKQDRTEKAIAGLPDRLIPQMRDILEEHGVGRASVSTQQLKDTIRSVLEEAGLLVSSTPVETAVSSTVSTVHYWEQDGKLHLLPYDFVFPSVDALTAWKIWWFGNAATKCPPLRRVGTSDLSSRQKRKTYSEWLQMMNHITRAAQTARKEIIPRRMTEPMAVEWFMSGVDNLDVDKSVAQRRWSQLKVTTLLRLVREASEKQNPNRVIGPKRTRKRPRRSMVDQV